MHSEREDRNVDEGGEGDDGGARDGGGGRVHGAEFGSAQRAEVAHTHTQQITKKGNIARRT